MSFSSFKNNKLIFENFRKFVNEEEESEDPRAVLKKAGEDLTKHGVVKIVDFLNSPAGQDPKVRQALRLGDKDTAPGDEVMSVKPATPAVGAMVPTQNEISLMKSIGFPLSKVDSVNNVVTGDITGRKKRIVTSGNLVIDGHHRWSSMWAVAGKGVKINATDISLPGTTADQKLAGAQLAIAATMKPDSGKVPSASAKDVDDEGKPLPSDNILGKGSKEIAQMIIDRRGQQGDPKAGILLADEYLRDIVNSPVAQKVWGLKPDMGPEETMKRIVKVVANNLSQLPEPQGPERDYMPQFDGGDTHKGQVSLGDVGDTMKQGKTNYKSLYESELSRWKQIIKG